MARGDLQVQDLRVIMMLAQARASVTTHQISERLQIPLRTVQRIIAAIEAIPLQLHRDAPGMGGGIRLVGDLSLKVTLPSNLLEMAALGVARDRLRDATLLGEAFEQFVDRTLATMTREQREISERFTRVYRTKEKPRAAPNPIAATVHKAIASASVLHIAYKGEKRAIEPAGVWVTEQDTYVVAFDRKRQSIRTFALDRIASARVGDETFTPRDDFDVAAYFKNALGAFVGDGPLPLEFVLDAEATRRLGGKLPTAGARLKKTRAGATLKFEAPLSDEILSWMAGLGPGVRIVSPPEAVTFVKDGFHKRARLQ